MFGLGMNNNGTGLVLASMTLAAHPLVLLPIIFYNLVRHLVAGAVAMLLSRPAFDLPGEGAGGTRLHGGGSRRAHDSSFRYNDVPLSGHGK